jgi:hypothetical protein
LKSTLYPINLVVVWSNLADIRNDHNSLTSRRQEGRKQFRRRIVKDWRSIQWGWKRNNDGIGLTE